MREKSYHLSIHIDFHPLIQRQWPVFRLVHRTKLLLNQLYLGAASVSAAPVSLLNYSPKRNKREEKFSLKVFSVTLLTLQTKSYFKKYEKCIIFIGMTSASKQSCCHAFNTKLTHLLKTLETLLHTFNRVEFSILYAFSFDNLTESSFPFLCY